MSWSDKSEPRHSSLRPLLLSLSVVGFFFFLLFLLLLSNGQHSRRHLQATKFTDVNKIVHEDRRLASVASGGHKSSMLLAKDRTHRRDPSNHFKFYNGGWNITDDHYWASASFSALPLFLLAAIWFVLFGFTLLIAFICYCCCRKKSYGYSPSCYAISLILFTLFTIVSILGCVCLYIAQGKFNMSAQQTLNYIANQADGTSKNLTSVSTYLDSAKKIGIQGMTLPPDMKNKIASIQQKAASASQTVTDQTRQNYDRVMKMVLLVRCLLIALASIMVLLTLCGFGFSLYGAKCMVYFLVILGWVLITATFILSGVFLVLHNVMGDTCVAMHEWVHSPTVHTALDDILPCVDKAAAEDVLKQSKGITRQLVFMIDSVITNVSNVDILPEAPASVYYNQSGPFLPVLCSPYNPDLTDRSCLPGEVDYSNAAKIWSNFVCKVAIDNRTCITPGRLNPTYYEQAVNIEFVSHGLYKYTPFLVELADCTFVRKTFKVVSKSYCPLIQKSTTWIYGGLILVSLSSMFALIFWAVYARERRHRVYSKELVKGSMGGGFSYKR